MSLKRLSIRIAPVLCALIAVPGIAVENVDPVAQFAVVGVIAGAKDGTDVAVIRDTVTKKSVTVGVGAKIGRDHSYTISKIARRKVEVTKGGKRFVLENVVAEKVPEKSSTFEVEDSNYFESGLINFASEISNGDDYQKEEWRGEEDGSNSDGNGPNSDSYQLLNRTRTGYRGLPLLFGREQADEVNYKNFSDPENDSEINDEERKFRENAYRYRIPAVDLPPDRSDGLSPESREE